MADMMTFPETVEEFMEQYKITDTEQIYTNGTELVPIFRMKQWFEHLPSAEPQWIPVSERLPEEKKDVLIAFKHNMAVGFWEDVLDNGEPAWYANSGDGWMTGTTTVDSDGIPIAWMPLPKPYKEGD